jgi:hypothetical protein
MSEYVHIIEEDSEDGIGIMKALSILSAHEHRDTPHWRLVEEQHFKNGRHDETHMFVENRYDKPHEYYVPIRMLVFEVEAIARAYVMEDVERQVQSIRNQDDDDED